MEQKHTGGKWENYAGRRKFKEAIFIVAVQPNGERVFVGRVYGYEGQPVEANAKLITEAPKTKQQRDDLLAALSAIIDWATSRNGTAAQDEQNLIAINEIAIEAIASVEKQAT